MTHRYSHATLAMLTVLATLALSTSAALAAAPEKPVTEAATGVTATEAALHGELNPGASATAGYDFTYNTNGTCAEGATSEQEGEKTGEAIKVEALVKELIPSTEYTFCVVANHTEEEVTESTSGEPLSFKTSALQPVVDAESASSVTPFAATLEALVNPENQPTTSCVFEYGPLTAEEKTAPCEPGTLEGFGDQLAAAPITELSPSTTYHYRVVVENATGRTEGPVQSFITVGPPLVTSGTAQAVGRTGAQLTGASIDPVGALVTYSYRYIDQAGYEAGLSESPSNPYVKGASSQPSRELAAGYGAQAITPVAIRELTPGTTYHFALVAKNSAGTTIGPDATFTTLPGTPPLATTGAAEGVTQISAIITGLVDTRGLPTIVQFEFGTVPFAGSLQPASSTPGAGSLLTASTSFTNDLEPGTTYYYRTVATNADGTVYGAEQSFTTGTFPAQGGPAPVQLVTFPGFVLQELAAGQPPPVGAAPSKKALSKKQKLAKTLKACAKKAKKKRPGCRRQAERRYR